MPTVHVYVSTGRFASDEDLSDFVEARYTENGERVPSPFMREVGVERYEPACIEAVRSDRPVPLSELLEGASYGERWLPRIEGVKTADAAVCVFEPNELRRPEGSSLEYLGSFFNEP